VSAYEEEMPRGEIAAWEADAQLGLDGSAVPAKSIHIPAADPDEATLDAIVALWHEADALHDEAEELKDEARGKEMLSEDKLDDAQDLIDNIVYAHPEWKGALEDGKDPRATSWDE